MPLYEFKKDEILFNTIKAYPKNKFFIYNGKVYYQDSNTVSGSNTSNITGVPSGYVSLYSYNIDRVQQDTGRVIGVSSSNGYDNVKDLNVIYPWIVKSTDGYTFKTQKEEDYNITPDGAILTGSYFLSSSIKRIFISSSYEQDSINYNYNKYSLYTASNPQATDKEIIENLLPQYIENSPLHSLRQIFDSYSWMSPIFLFDSGAYSASTKLEQDTNLISIPSIFYGNKIKKGSVTLKYYITGTLVATAQDTKQNGELVQTYALHDTREFPVVGGVMYKHGFIFLYDTASLAPQTLAYRNTSNSLTSNWIHWGVGAGDYDLYTPTAYFPFKAPITGSNLVSASYSIEFSGTNFVPNYTYFASAPKGELNWSNNPTYLSNLTTSSFISSSTRFVQTDREIKNILSSSISTYSASFENVTYINRVNLYDDMGNLIGVAKTSKPIKKTEDTDFTFKLKLDM